jgi:hypothetical protein
VEVPPAPQLPPQRDSPSTETGGGGTTDIEESTPLPVVSAPIPPTRAPGSEVIPIAPTPLATPTAIGGAELGAPSIEPPEIQLVTPNTPMPVVSVELAQLSNGLDTLAQQLDTEKTRSVIVIGSATGMTALLSAGYVLWAVRGGSLLASMLATLPVWRWIDPLPILENREDEKRRKRKRGANAKDDEQEKDEERMRSLLES